MHVRVRVFGKPEAVVVVESKITKIEKFRRIIQEKFDVEPKLQRLFYGGKLLEDGYTFHDYNIKLNDVIQLMVTVEPVITSEKESEVEKKSDNDDISKDEEKEELYTDTESQLYAVGDLVDVRERDGSWAEGKIVRICLKPDANASQKLNSSYSGINIDNNKIIQKLKTEDDEKKRPINTANDDSNGTKTNSIAKYFTKISKPGKDAGPEELFRSEEECLLFKVHLDADKENTKLYCKLKEIRPRARSIRQVEDLKIGQKIMVNYNPQEPLEKGNWFDFKVSKIKKLRRNYELVGTLYVGPDAVSLHDTKVRVQDKIYDIEDVVPLNERTIEYNKRMEVIPEKRSVPLNCLTCRDDEEAACKECGCFVCSGKESPDKIVLCDECNYGYHITCLKPPLSVVPEDDWYCPSCKRDPNNVVAPGAAKQTKKTSSSKSTRDWGRGMACIGKTKTCAMPANHFGPIPGIEVGMCWRFRIQLSESGVHRPPVSGIHGRDVEGAYSIVLSGGYEDDVDNGNEFTYTGSGGRDLSGNKRTAEQSCDQTLTRENRALARNCAVNRISEEGGDAGDNWREGKPVRVVRSYKMLKHFPKYAPKEGIRYDGIYKVVKYYSEKGLSGYRVWKYLLRRDDPNPAPWETGRANHYPIIYPDGYLEAEAEKKAMKEKVKNSKGKNKKRPLQESYHTTEPEEETAPPVKKRKVHSKSEIQGKKKGSSTITKRDGKTKTMPSPKKSKSLVTSLSTEEKEAIEADMVNNKIWSECLAICESSGKMKFVEFVTEMFMCIICQDVVANPVTTPCLHNFCMTCIKQAFKLTGSYTCPYCRHDLAKYEPEYNEELKKALRTILTGYDAGKK